MTSPPISRPNNRKERCPSALLHFKDEAIVYVQPTFGICTTFLWSSVLGLRNFRISTKASTKLLQEDQVQTTRPGTFDESRMQRATTTKSNHWSSTNCVPCDSGWLLGGTLFNGTSSEFVVTFHLLKTRCAGLETINLLHPRETKCIFRYSNRKALYWSTLPYL